MTNESDVVAEAFGEHHRAGMLVAARILETYGPELARWARERARQARERAARFEERAKTLDQLPAPAPTITPSTVPGSDRSPVPRDMGTEPLTQRRVAERCAWAGSTTHT